MSLGGGFCFVPPETNRRKTTAIGCHGFHTVPEADAMMTKVYNKISKKSTSGRKGGPLMDLATVFALLLAGWVARDLYQTWLLLRLYLSG